MVHIWNVDRIVLVILVIVYPAQDMKIVNIKYRVLESDLELYIKK